MPRISVYIPQPLYEQMQALGGGINFSMVAQAAIRNAVASASVQPKESMKAQLLDVPTRGDYRLFEVPLPGRPYRVKVSGTTMAIALEQPLDDVVTEFARRQIRQGADLEDGNVVKVCLVSAEAQEIDAFLTAKARGLTYRCSVQVNGHHPGVRIAEETYHVLLSCESVTAGPDQVYAVDVVLPFMPGRSKWEQLDRDARRRCIESAARAHIHKHGLPLAWGYEGGKHVIRLARHPANPEPGDPGEPFTMRE